MSDREKPKGGEGGAVDRDALARLRRPGAVGRTVLVVEDNDEHRYLFAHLLRTSGYTVIETGDGVRGIAESRRARPDLILLDLGVPGLDGYQVIQLVRAEPTTRDVPILAVSVHAFPADVARAMALGCTHFLAKPALPREVVTTVHEMLGLADDASSGG